MAQFRKLLLLGIALAGTSVLALEEGRPDFRISAFGPNLNAQYQAFNPAVAHNPNGDEYLTVWSGNFAGEFEIFAQRISARSGHTIGPQNIQVSQMGPDGNLAFAALDPDIAHNWIANEYLVVWWGNERRVLGNGGAGSSLAAKNEVFGRRLDSNGAPLGPQFRISAMGADDDPLAEAINPVVIYNALQNEYFVAWSGDNIGGVFVNQDFEIWAQRISAQDDSLIGSVIRVSDMGEAEGDPSFTAADVSIALNPDLNQYFLAWEGDDDGGSAVDGEQEIYGQLIDASTGAEIGTNDFRISFLGPEGDTGFDGGNASVVYNPISEQYLVAWNGSDDTGGSIRNDIEVHIQRLSSDAEQVGEARRISTTGPDGVTTFWGLSPRASVSAVTGEYLVIWRAEGQEINNEWEIYGRRLNHQGLTTSPTQRISVMGPEGNASWDAGLPDIAYDTTNDRFLAVWDGEDDRSDLVDNEFEIFGQFLNLDIFLSDGFE